MKVRVRVPAGAIGSYILEKDSPLCIFRGLGRKARIDIEGTLVSPEEDISRINRWVGQRDERVLVQFDGKILSVPIETIKDIVIVA